MIQSGGFLGRPLHPLPKTGLALIKNVMKPLAKSVLIPLKLTATELAADSGMNKKISGSRIMSNDEWKEIMKIVESLEDSGLLLKGVNETIQNEVKEQKGIISMSLGTLGASLSENMNMLAGKEKNTAGKGFIRIGYGSKTSSIKEF